MFFALYESAFLGVCKFGNRVCFVWGTRITHAFSIYKHVIQIKIDGFLYERKRSFLIHQEMQVSDFNIFFVLMFKHVF